MPLTYYFKETVRAWAQARRQVPSSSLAGAVKMYPILPPVLA